MGGVFEGVWVGGEGGSRDDQDHGDGDSFNLDESALVKEMDTQVGMIVHWSRVVQRGYM